MRRAIPRAWIDIEAGEMTAVLAQLLGRRGAPEEKAVSDFEAAFARTIGTKEAVSFPSARAGIYFGLRALNLRKNDEVILPAYTFWIDAAMVVMAGLRPVFVDVDRRSANIDPGRIEKCITDKTRVIFLSHLNGLPAEMGAIRAIAQRHGLRLMEDCARACGVRLEGKPLGSSDIGIFSFGYGKNLYLFGGGMVTSSDRSFIERLRDEKKAFGRMSGAQLLGKTIEGCLLRILNTPPFFSVVLFPLIRRYKVKGDRRLALFFEQKKASYDRPPASFYRSLSRIQAGQGIRFLKRIDGHNQKRHENAKVLREALTGIPGLHTFLSSPAAGAEMLYFALHSGRKKELQRFLLSQGIDVEDESAADLTQMDEFKKYAGGQSYPHAGALDGKVILLPCHPHLRPDEIRYMIEKVRDGCLKFSPCAG